MASVPAENLQCRWDRGARRLSARLPAPDRTASRLASWLHRTTQPARGCAVGRAGQPPDAGGGLSLRGFDASVRPRRRSTVCRGPYAALTSPLARAERQPTPGRPVPKGRPAGRRNAASSAGRHGLHARTASICQTGAANWSPAANPAATAAAQTVSGGQAAPRLSGSRPCGRRQLRHRPRAGRGGQGGTDLEGPIERSAT